MKHLIAVFGILCLLVSASVLPTLAQDTPAAPEPCNADQVKQVTDTALQWGDQMNTISQKAYDKTLDGGIEEMLDWSDLYTSFFSDTYPNLPTCIDGVIYGNAVGLMLSRQMNLETMMVLNAEQNAAKTSDADVNKVLQDAFSIQNTLAKVGVSSINAVATQLKSGTGITNWLPACPADQTELGTQLTDLEQTHTDLQPAMQAYLEDGTVEKDTYIAVLKLVNDTATLANTNPEPCADDYMRLVGDIYTHGDALTTLTLGQIAPYMSDNVNADRFNTLLQYCNDALNSYLNGATATATATAEP